MESLFLKCCIKYKLLTTCFKEILEPCDLCILRSTCKTLNSILPKNNRKGKSLPDILVKHGYFKLFQLFSCNCIPIAFFGSIAKTQEDEKIQKQLLIDYDTWDWAIIISCRNFQNDKILKWMKEQTYDKNKQIKE